MSRHKQRLQISIGLVFDCLWAQAYFTTFGIGLNVFMEAWLILFLVDEVFGFIDAKMSCKRIVVVSTDELCSDGFWDKK